MSTDTTFYCTECNADVDDEDKFCPQCGEPLDNEEPTGFCEEIGEDERQYCPHCEAPVARGDKECMFCRKSLQVAPRSHFGCFSVILLMIGCTIACGVVAYFSFFMVDVPADHIGVKEMHDPPLDPAQRGVQREILPAGRHVVNPFLWEVEVVECVKVPPGYVGIIKDETGKLRPLVPGRYPLPPDQVKIIDIRQRKFFYIEDEDGGFVDLKQHETPPGTQAEIDEDFFE